MTEMKSACDAVLDQAVAAGVPGVVAVATDRERTTYTGTAGVRTLGEDQPMTPDTVLAIFSTTKAITGTTCLQLVESGDLDLDAPAREYAPAIGDLQVLDGFAADGTPQLRPPASDITSATTGSPRSRASPASSPPRAPPSRPRSSSTPGPSGSTAATSTGPGRSWRASPASAWAR
jgi:CubicO group peptidase (beta-lactamase class C family)